MTQPAVAGPSAAEEAAGGAGVLASAAVIGAGIGVFALGPLGLIAGAATSVYMATRQDEIGQISRNVGQAGIDIAQAAVKLDREHHIVEKTGAAVAATAAEAKK